MEKKTRIFLLIILGFLFLIISPLLIFYSTGYRFDFEKKEIVSTGGLYLKVSPLNADVFIDGKFKKQIGFFPNYFFIQNLLPRKHEILIKKEGYHSWQKTLEIKEKEVIKAENIILFKEKPVFELSQDDINNFFFSPGNTSEELFFIKENALYSKDEKTLPIITDLVAYTILANNIIWLEDTGFLYRSKSSGSIIEVFNVKPFLIDENSEYKIITEAGILFIKENDKLFFLNPRTKIFEELHSKVLEVKFSPNLKKVVFLNDYEIWILDLTSDSFEKIFLTRFSEKIDNIFWLNNYYLIFNSGDRIKISEIDIRDRINIVDIGEGSKIFWNKNNKKVYLLKDNTLFVSEKLIP